ncbi:MAG: sigma-70 family RNA polymerase sigma factor [Planctomycetes bacterium]|nr:sigma-70 family RNA polymerase sigma factor [Planctomycetota bacterium]
MEELDLVQGLRERREDVLAVFLERYRPLFYHCITHFESDHSAREDLYQEVVLYVLERLDKDRFDSTKGSFGTWLYRVAWCRCVDLKRKQGARRNPRLTTVGEKLPERVDPTPSPRDQAADGEISELVRRGLATLEIEERALLQLRFVDGRTIGEISDELSISLEQTKYRLKRASTSLRRVLLNELALEEAADER